jgi:hypothetical protein
MPWLQIFLIVAIVTNCWVSLLWIRSRNSLKEVLRVLEELQQGSIQPTADFRRGNNEIRKLHALAHDYLSKKQETDLILRRKEREIATLEETISQLQVDRVFTCDRARVFLDTMKDQFQASQHFFEERIDLIDGALDELRIKLADAKTAERQDRITMIIKILESPSVELKEFHRVLPSLQAVTEFLSRQPNPSAILDNVINAFKKISTENLRLVGEEVEIEKRRKNRMALKAFREKMLEVDDRLKEEHIRRKKIDNPKRGAIALDPPKEE